MRTRTYVSNGVVNHNELPPREFLGFTENGATSFFATLEMSIKERQMCSALDLRGTAIFSYLISSTVSNRYIGVANVTIPITTCQSLANMFMLSLRHRPAKSNGEGDL